MANLIFNETFEGSTFFPENETVKATLNTVHAIENNGDPTSLTVATYAGRKAARFLLSKALPLYQGDTYRNEVTIVKAEEDSRVTAEGWYSFNLLFPADGGGADARKTSINQWFEDGSDELTLRTMNGTCFLELQGGVERRWDLFSSAKGEGGVYPAFTPHPIDQWNHFAFHINHKFDATGFIELYRNGVKIHEYHGPTIHLKVPKWKIGIYSSFTKSTLPYKIVFFDDVKVGNNLSSLDEMMAAGGVVVPPDPIPTPDPIPAAFKVSAGNDITVEAPGKTASFSASLTDLAPETYTVKLTATDSKGATVSDELTVVVKAPVPVSTSVIKGFTLINAETEKAVTPVIDGGVYSIAQYGKKFNLKAETDDAAVTSVKFELSGAQIKTSTDKAAPFTLMGDSGTGNFYYGTWGPPPVGSYTLKATPYKGTLAMEPITIHFSFII